jgi:hypothetical protein
MRECELQSGGRHHAQDTGRKLYQEEDVTEENLRIAVGS